MTTANRESYFYTLIFLERFSCYQLFDAAVLAPQRKSLTLKSSWGSLKLLRKRKRIPVGRCDGISMGTAQTECNKMPSHCFLLTLRTRLTHLFISTSFQIWVCSADRLHGQRNQTSEYECIMALLNIANYHNRYNLPFTSS